MAEKQITKFIVADQVSKLSDLAIGHQQIIFIKDKQKIALDYNGERIFYNHIEILQTENERKELTTQKNGIFYFVIGTASLWFYEEKWIGDISRGRRSSMPQPKTRPDSPVPSLQAPFCNILISNKLQKHNLIYLLLEKQKQLVRHKLTDFFNY